MNKSPNTPVREAVLIPDRDRTISPSHILVVDDHPDGRQLSVDVLAGAGYTVDAVKDGAAGWEAIQAHHYDLVITDNKMPRMTGLEMIEKLLSTGVNTPVLLATGELPTHEFARRPWLKPDATLLRPFSNEDLLEAVKTVLRTAPGPDSRKAVLLPKASEACPDQTLRASELRYRRLFEAARDGILILDVDTGRITDVNPFLIRLLGFSHREMVGRTVGELSPFKDIEANHVMLERLQKDGYVRYEDLPLETRDGRQIAVEFVSNVYLAGDRKVIQCNVRDITERKRTEKALRESEERYRAYVTTSSDVVYQMSPDWTEMRHLRGRDFIVDTDKPSGTWLQEYIHPDDQPHVMAAINEAIRTKSSFELEHRVWRVDGTLGWTFSHAVPLLDARGEIVEWFGAARDVTERKRATEEIRCLNAELEHRVVERTAQLQAANQELETFSYSVAHDLRAPLRHVLGFVDLLQKDAGPSLSELSLRYLTTISQAAKRMENLIVDLLAFSRFGQTEMQKKEVNLDRLVQETLSDYQEETKERNIAWEIHPLPAVRADRALLRMVLVNLISNAVKFTGLRAEPRIEIGCAPGAAGETVIFIRDNGAGFDPRYAGKLFGVFQRLHSQDEFEGTGIGLANVQRIIHRHGGRTWAEGVVDGGATFYFSLPKQDEARPGN